MRATKHQVAESVSYLLRHMSKHLNVSWCDFLHFVFLFLIFDLHYNLKNFAHGFLLSLFTKHNIFQERSLLSYCEQKTRKALNEILWQFIDKAQSKCHLFDTRAGTQCMYGVFLFLFIISMSEEVEVIMDSLLGDKIQICEESANILMRDIMKRYCDSTSEIPKNVSIQYHLFSTP